MTLRIGTAHFLNSASRQMLAQQAKADRLQAEIATGVRVTTPSIDPAAASRAARLDGLRADDKQYLTNAKLASSMLESEDTALETIEIQIQRARELAVRASNETLTAEDRRGIGIELDAILDDLFVVANQKDGRDQPLFGGTASGDAFARDDDGVISYIGVGEPAELPVAPGTSIAAGDSGQRLFGAIDLVDGNARTMFAVLGDLAASLQDDALTAEDRRAAIDTGLSGLAAVTDRIAGARASVGARGARLEVEMTRLEDLVDARTIESKALTGADTEASILELQQTLILLQASQASFTQISRLNLFDLLR